MVKGKKIILPIYFPSLSVPAICREKSDKKAGGKKEKFLFLVM
jgi:hypothetical protein